MKALGFVLTLFITINAYASDWEKIYIPGARCGDGKPYSVLLQKKNTTKLLVEFMGGGVCWNHHSCFKATSLLPWLHPYPTINSYSIPTADGSKINPFATHSKLYFPYCTADVHSGDHVSLYKGRTVYHYGKRNIELAFQYLKENHYFAFENVNDLVVYGASAGGIASLVHGKFISGFVDPEAHKTLIADSPGLHFGKTFWNKFDEDMKADFKESFNNVKLDVDFNDGAVSKRMGPVFDYYQDWNVGIVLGLQDSVMSKSFGDISPQDEKKLILSTDGIPYVATLYPNVKVWLKDTSMHTFMLSRYSASLHSLQGETVYEFVKRVYDQK